MAVLQGGGRHPGTTDRGQGWRPILRVALLTASEPAQAGAAAGPAFLRVGGQLVARHQVALALAAGCRRIICIARGFPPDFAALQRDAEQAGATFHVVGGAAGLSGLVTAADEVLAVAEGLLPTPGDALPLLTGGQSVLVQPAAEGVAAGFERIDPEQAWAGLMLVPGRLVDRLMDLAPDIDPVSALLRIVLQAGVARRSVPEAVRAGGHWLLIRSEADAQLAEERWMARHTMAGPRTPGPALARFLARRFGAAVLHEGSSGAVGLGIAVLLVVLGLAAGWFGHMIVAFALAALAEVLLATSLLLAGLRHGALGQERRRPWLPALAGIGFDLLLVVLLVFAMPLLPGQAPYERCFAPAMLLGLLRLLPQAFTAAWLAWLDDRLVLVALLAVLAAGGVLGPAVLVLSVVLLMAGLALAARAKAEGSAQLTGA